MNTLRLFSTDVTTQRLDAAAPYLPALREALLTERTRSPGIEASQVGGWHSTPDLSQRPGPPFRPVMEAIVQAVGGVLEARARERQLLVPAFGWSVHAWAIVLDPGGYNRVHDHATSHWSVAYYVDAGDPGSALGGALTFLDPRRAAPAIPGLDLYPSTLDVPAETGSLVIFPSYLQHMVHPYDGARPRICISANLTLTPRPPRS